MPENLYAYELTHAAQRLVTAVRPVRPGQQVLLTADTASDPRVVQAVAGAVLAVGGVPTVITYPTLPAPMLAPPRPVAAAALAADVWLDFSIAYQLYSPAYEAALEAGCIYLCLTGMDVDLLVRTVGQVKSAPMHQMALRLYQLAQAARVVRVTSPAGTDLRMTVDPAGDPFWDQLEHLQDERPAGAAGFPQMLGGQSGFMAHRESYEGVLVFDGALWPPADLGVLKVPVRLVMKGGYIQSIEGGLEAKLFERWLESFHHPQAYLMEHACFGFNPGVRRPSGRILEDERVFGCMQFGIGATPLGSPAHTDGVTLNPSVWLDEVQIEEQGRYILPELMALCHAMGAEGY